MNKTEATQHAIELEQCSLFIDSDPLKKAMTDAAAFLRTLAFLPDSAEPVAWIIPGDDNARDDGFIDARITRQGEFSKPLYPSPPAQPVAPAAITLNGFQLRDALEFLAPDGTDEQLEQEVSIQWGPQRTHDEGTDPEGFYCWLTEYPDEGSIPLDPEPHAQVEVTPDSNVVITRDESGAIVAVTRQNSEGQILEVLAEAEVAPSDCTPSDTNFATTGELARELGASPDKAKRIETRMEYLAGNTPKVVEPTCSQCDGDQEQCDAHDCGDAHKVAPAAEVAEVVKGLRSVYEMIRAYSTRDSSSLQALRAAIDLLQRPAVSEWRPIDGAPEMCIVGWLSGTRVLRAEAARRNPLLGWYTLNGNALHNPTHFIDLPSPSTTKGGAP